MTPVKIPKYIDSPMQLAFWEIDEVAPLIAMMVLGIMINSLLYCMLFAIVAMRAYQRYKENTRRGAVLAFLQWQGLYCVGSRIRNGQARLLVG